MHLCKILPLVFDPGIKILILLIWHNYNTPFRQSFAAIYSWHVPAAISTYLLLFQAFLLFLYDCNLLSPTGSARPGILVKAVRSMPQGHPPGSDYGPSVNSLGVI